MTAFVADAIADRRFFALLVVGFALLALSLTVVGVYGTAAFAAAGRRREVGVRFALGATTGSVVRTMVSGGMRPIAAGTTVGVLVSLGATRLMGSMLYGVTPTDPVTIGAAVFVVLLASTAATVVPAVRASRVDPVVSLGTE